MNTSHQILIAVIGGILAGNSPALAAAPKVEETVVGPANAGGMYTVSPHGVHVAYVGKKGDRFVVTIDGVEGPAFDELFTPNGAGFTFLPRVSVQPSTPGGLQGGLVPVIFSPNGEHYAYAGGQGGDYIVIHDGKEVARGPRPSLALNYGSLTLSPTGKHVYWDEIKTSGGNGTWRVMMTGKPGPWSSNNNGIKPVFSADDSRYAYTAMSQADSRKQLLVVDGKTEGYTGGEPVFTADGKKLLSIGHGADGKAALLVDGKPAITGIQITKVVPGPAGGRYAAIVRTKFENGQGTDMLFIDGKEVPGSDHAQDVWFSPDGKRYAAVCHNPFGGPFAMVVDGKKTAEYPRIDAQPPYWTPDSSRLIYSAGTSTQSIIVVDGQESPITSLMGHTPIAMADQGNRYAFGTRDGSNRNFTLVVDGQPVLPPAVYPVDDSLTFSGDGSRFAYLVGPVGRGEITGLIVDGVLQPGLAPGFFAKWLSMDLITPAFTFSRDGKHLAFMAHTADPNSGGMYLDGQLVYPTRRGVFRPVFTPDGQHLFWIAEELIPGQHPDRAVYVDGRLAVRMSGGSFDNLTGVWDLERDGALRIVAADGDAVKRYRITPAADTSIATILTDAVAAKAQAVARALQAAADAAAAKEKAAADAAAAKAKAKADYDAAVAAKARARQDALDARAKARADAAAAKAAKKN